MEILIDDIPDEGLDISATANDPWLAQALKESLGDACDAGCGARLKLHISRVDGNVNVDGEIDTVSHPSCDRCLAQYDDARSVHIHEVLAPLYESERQRRLEKEMEVELVAEDMEFSFYEGDRFDLGEVVREQLALAQPMRHLCSEDCRGLCQRCGKNLNDGPCGCPPEGHKGSFEALKGLRVEGKKVEAKVKVK
ncbi:MAG: DUF177 domain-containing protein, partial [Proteobacteria bacterium]|nr:DUF177 domain-containing protein [Pseudomonadota bacterium]